MVSAGLPDVGMSAAPMRDRYSTHLEKWSRTRSPAPKKKEQGEKPCSKNCVDPISPKIGLDLD
jgi:hypothetical protein